MAGSSVYSNGYLPYIMVRDDGQDTSGVHLIGLDGSVYLTASSSYYADNASNAFQNLGHLLQSPAQTFLSGGSTFNKSVIGGTIDAVSSQERENDIVRIRGLQGHLSALTQEMSDNGSSLDFASDSNNDVKTY
jgi:hypothetical protein